MVHSTRITPSSRRIEERQPVSNAWNAIVEGVLQAQGAQLQALFAWQQAIDIVQREAYDAWACRWAGGAPIDA